MEKHLNNATVAANIVKRKIKSILDSLKTFPGVLGVLAPLVELSLFARRRCSDSGFAFSMLGETILSSGLLNLFL